MKQMPKTLAMVLAGGRVDELSALTYYRPKSTLPFGGFARIIDFPLSNLMNSRLERVGILSQYHSYSLINHIGIGAAWDMIGRYRGISILPPFQGSETSLWYRGSADAVYQNLDFVRYHKPENVLILSGDHVYQMDYREIIDYHQEVKADLTMALLPVPPEKAANRFGVAQLDENSDERGGRIIGYEEKPAVPKSEWGSLTIYCFNPEILYAALIANAAENDSHEFGRDIIPKLLQERRRVYGFKFKGYWGYARTMEEYWQTNMDLLGENPKISLREWGIRTNLEHRDIRDCPPLKTGGGAVIRNSHVYNGAIIDGFVENSIIFPRVHVARGAVVRDSILFFNNSVGENCRFDKVISDINNSFGPGCIVGEEGPPAGKKVTTFGKDNHIPADTLISTGCILYPNLNPEIIPEIIPAGRILR